MVAQSKIRQEALKWKTSRSSRKWKRKKVDWKDEIIFSVKDIEVFSLHFKKEKILNGENNVAVRFKELALLIWGERI